MTKEIIIYYKGKKKIKGCITFVEFEMNILMRKGWLVAVWPEGLIITLNYIYNCKIYIEKKLFLRNYF